jgi:hypothetical protein
MQVEAEQRMSMEPALVMESSFAGSLREVPFAHLLVHLFDTGRSGTLLLRNEAGGLEARIRFEAGVPTAARLDSNATSLLQALIPLCAHASGEFELLENQDALGDGSALVGQVDPFGLIAAALRGPVREDAVESVLDELGASALRLEPGVNLERYALGPQERVLVEQLRHRAMTLEQLRARSELSERVVRRLVYLLCITRGLRATPLSRQSSSGTIAQAPPLPARSTRPPTPSRPAAATVQFSRLPGATLIESSANSGVRPRVGPPPLARSRLLPGSPTGAGGRYHVRSPQHSSTEVVAPERVPERARTSRAPAQPTVPPAGLSETHGSSAAQYRRKAELLLRRNDYAGALQQAERALELDDSASHEAFYAWLLYLRHSATGRVHPEAWTRLKLALKRDPSCDRAYFYKGMLLKQLERLEEAQLHFKRALKLNPDNLDAAREVRLFEVRNRGKSGLLQRLLEREPGSKERAG